MKIKYEFADKTVCEVEVDEEFAKQYEEIEYREKLVDRKETRRHQSLDKSLENGWDVEDWRINIEKEIEYKERNKDLQDALKVLTYKQKQVLIFYILEGFSFREIGDKRCDSTSKNTQKLQKRAMT